MKTSEAVNELFPALQKAHAKLKPAAKDNTNPAFRSKYADLAAYVEVLQPIEASEGLFTVQEPTSDDSGVHVTTRICHTSGQWIEFGPLFIPANKHDAQGFGSAVSYARRYALSAAWSMVADDDDGNAAVKSQAQPAAVPVPVGYEDWFTDMQALAATVPDLQVFRDSYAASPKKHRHYLETTNKAALDAMVETAKANESALLSAAKG